MLSRLADVEARLKALEGEKAEDANDEEAKSRKRARVGCERAQVNYPSSQTESRTPPQLRPYQLQQQSTSRGEREAIELGEPPVLHTASACQMLHSWPRLRVCLDDNVDPLSFLRKADQEQPVSSVDPGISLDCGIVMRAVDEFYSHLGTLPETIQYLFETGLCLDHRAMVNWCRRAYHDRLEIGALGRLHLSQLVVLAMAFRIYDATDPGLEHVETDMPRGEVKISDVSKAAQATLWYALNQQHNIHDAYFPSSVALSLALAYSLTYFWARPFQAMEILHGIDTKLKRWSIRAPDDP